MKVHLNSGLPLGASKVDPSAVHLQYETKLSSEPTRERGAFWVDGPKSHSNAALHSKPS